MSNYIDALSVSNEVKQNIISKGNEKSNDESFANVFKKVMDNKNVKQNKPNSIHLENPEEEIAAIKEQKRIEDAMEKLAGFFGIGKHLMLAILQSLKIDPKDLIDPNKRADIIKMLKKKFGLSDEKAEALSKLMDSF